MADDLVYIAAERGTADPSRAAKRGKRRWRSHSAMNAAASPPAAAVDPGSRNRRPGLVDHLPPEAFANIAAKLYQQALDGDVAAAKLLVDRYDPVPRHGRVNLPLPAGDGLEGPQGAVALAAGALAAATRGEVGLDEALAVIDGLRRLGELRRPWRRRSGCSGSARSWPCCAR